MRGQSERFRDSVPALKRYGERNSIGKIMQSIGKQIQPPRRINTAIVVVIPRLRLAQAMQKQQQLIVINHPTRAYVFAYVHACVYVFVAYSMYISLCAYVYISILYSFVCV